MLIIYEEKLHSSFEEVDKSVRMITNIMSGVEGLEDDSLLFKVSFVLRELMNNSVEHGNTFDFDKKIYCKVWKDKNKLFMKVSDEGHGIHMENNYYDGLGVAKRERHRGLKLIKELNFDIVIDEATVQLELMLM